MTPSLENNISKDKLIECTERIKEVLRTKGIEDCNKEISLLAIFIKSPYWGFLEDKDLV